MFHLKDAHKDGTYGNIPVGFIGSVSICTLSNIQEIQLAVPGFLQERCWQHIIFCKGLHKNNTFLFLEPDSERTDIKMMLVGTSYFE